MTQGMIEVSARGNPGSQDCVTFGESLDLSEPVSSSGKRKRGDSDKAMAQIPSTLPA